MNQAKLRGYKFLIEMKRITIEQVPELYKAEIQKQQVETQ